MGYQEVLVYAEDIEQLSSVVKFLGKDYFSSRDVSPVAIITINSDETQFDKGDKLLWITGERGYQRDIFAPIEGFMNEVLDQEDYSWTFIEEVSDQLFGENNEYLFDHEPFNWDGSSNDLTDEQLRVLNLYKIGDMDNSKLWELVKLEQIQENDVFSNADDSKLAIFTNGIFIEHDSLFDDNLDPFIIFEKDDVWVYGGKL